ncbi:MAG TPA: thiamine phosphate synthase [Vicinamibacterales bacterium]|nr:thiamine phosphate synthase [Vicinamibacterales bacterium]
MAITDRGRPDGGSPGGLDRLVEHAARAAEAGVTLIQVRERGCDDRTLCAVVSRILDALSSRATRVLVNERADIALACGAHGVHLPSEGLPAARVRSIVPPGFLIGRSVHTEAEARSVDEAGGCDYLVFGTVFETSSKPAGHDVAGLPALEAVCAAVRLPVLAIGGVSTDRFVSIAGAGAAGVAAIRLFADGSVEALSRIVEQLNAAWRHAGSKMVRD